MEKLNQIREELLASQNKLAKELQLGEKKLNFNITKIRNVMSNK